MWHHRPVCVLLTLYRHLQHFVLQMFGKPFKFYMVVLLSAVISNYFVCQNILKVMEMFIVSTRPECKFLVTAMLNGQYMTFQWTQHKHHWNQQNFLGLAAASGDWTASKRTFLSSSGNWIQSPDDYNRECSESASLLTVRPPDAAPSQRKIHWNSVTMKAFNDITQWWYYAKY